MAEKLTNSERERLDDLRTSLNNKVMSYGRQKYIVEQIEDQLENERQDANKISEEISEIEEEYDNFVRNLYEKYGDVAIDLDTGEIVEE